MNEGSRRAGSEQRDEEELEQLIIDVFYLPKEETSPTAMPSN